MDTQNIINTIVESVTVDGNINLDALNEIVDGLKKTVKLVKDEQKKAEKDARDEARAESAELAKAYYNSLAKDAVFSYKTSDGVIHEAKKIETKSKTGATAACELINPPANAKTTKRYPKFYQVVVPETFTVESDDVAEEIA